MRARALTVLAITVVAAFSTSGVAAAATGGEAAKPVEEILTDASTSLQGARSVAMKGTIASDGKRVTVNLVSGHGKGGGVMFVDGARFEIVLDGSDVYVKTDKATMTKLTGSQAAAQLVGNRWMKSTTTNPGYASISKLFDLDSMAKGLLTPDGPVTKGAATRFEGKPAIPLRDTGDDDPGILYIAAKGAPHPLAIVSASGKGRLAFTQYNSAKIPTAPTNAIDVDQLTAASSS